MEKVYLKHIWEITAASKNYPIGLQVKRRAPYAMRPCNFYRNEDAHFADILDFIDAVTKTYRRFESISFLPFTPDEWHDRVVSLFII
ncbi:hypothetical protein KJY78_03700 [Canibacter sp. lx-45]|uniref:hypothetical protein n=1 Tax=Canibacter zhuwentaonis TaxID=2837491 RepID=UPI001BDBE0B1|nr:hypothetical protein [Canibacter zhuwentaonis]MBT1035455.1 hypothetical protein [Canibacter zhuwentaonis]